MKRRKQIFFLNNFLQKQSDVSLILYYCKKKRFKYNYYCICLDYFGCKKGYTIVGPGAQLYLLTVMNGVGQLMTPMKQCQKRLEV